MYKDAGIGYSGPAISGGKFFTMGERDGEIYLIAIDIKNGKELWSTKFAKGFKNNWGNGPRGTPTVDGDKVYALAPKGEVICLNVKDGSEIWNSDLVDFGGKAPYWGFSESVLVDKDKIVVTPGGGKGAIVALNKETGKLIWQSKEIKDGVVGLLSLSDSIWKEIELNPENEEKWLEVSVLADMAANYSTIYNVWCKDMINHRMKIRKMSEKKKGEKEKEDN